MTRSLDYLFWAAMKAQIRPPERADAQEGPTGGPTLTRLRGRGESHLLVVMSLAAATFIALMIAKPWGGSVRPSGPPTAASIAAASVTSQPTAFIAIRPGASEAPPQGIVDQPGVVAPLTVICVDGPPAWPVVAASADPLTGLPQITLVMACTDANLWQLRVVDQPGEVAPLTVICADGPPAWPVVAASADPLTGLPQITLVMACLDANLRQLRVVDQPEP